MSTSRATNTPTTTRFARPEVGKAPGLRVLLVEDSNADAELLGEYLTLGLAPVASEMQRCVRVSEALEAVRLARPDVILLDLSLPDAGGLDALAAFIDAAPLVPVVVMTGLADERVATAAVRAGAQDYLVKGQDGPREVRRALRYAVERQELLAREREARFQAERAVRIRDEFLAVVSHDLRTPITAIKLCANRLATRDREVRELAGTITQSAEWSLRVINDLLDASALEGGGLALHREPMVVDAVTEAVAAMYAPLAEANGVELSVVAAGPGVWLEIDVDRIAQAVGNLVANAIRHTPRGGRVTLEAARAGDGVRISVRDTGTGIAHADLPFVFDRFWRGRQAPRGGTGLGLPIAKGIVDAHAGTIAVESVPGAGTVFHVALPPGRPRGA